MAAAGGVTLSHISRASSDIHRLANFYREILGFEQIESPDLEFNIIWLSLPPDHAVQIHLIERDPKVSLPEETSLSGLSQDPRFLRRGHHVCFSVSNFESFVQTLKDRGIKTHESSQPGSKVKQIFFFDPDGNGLEVASRPSPPS
uniref:VOC domain-containing protein n=1 Tax=Kalanchoe fedtschenkoi TaxID=63787 RepID=A0A7N0TKH3_KALFE